MARCRPEDCNLETDNLTIIWYHNYSGGKFMANCLSLSDHGLFGHKEITEAQLRGDFSPTRANSPTIRARPYSQSRIAFSSLTAYVLDIFAINKFNRIINVRIKNMISIINPT